MDVEKGGRVSGHVALADPASRPALVPRVGVVTMSRLEGELVGFEFEPIHDSDATAERLAWIEAFTKAQGDFPTIGKDSTVNTGSFTYKYASLPDIFDLVNPVLRRHDLVLSQSVGGTDGTIAVETRIAHKSGHVERYGPLVMKVSADPKSVGSAITYARRYALCAALGIAPDEDDDGAKATRVVQDANLGEPTELTPWQWLWDESAVFKAWDKEQRLSAIQLAVDSLAISSGQDMNRDEADRVWSHIQGQYESNEQGSLEV